MLGLLSARVRLFIENGMIENTSWRQTVQVTALCCVVPTVWVLSRWLHQSLTNTRPMNSRKDLSQGIALIGDQTDADLTDPGLLKKHSDFKSYTTSRYTYSRVRIFYHRHPQIHKLPKTPAPLPLLVFVHGLGGSVAQFHPLLTSLVNLGSCLAIDLPGCGMSSFSPTDWAAYTTDALAELLATIVEDYRDTGNDQGIVLIGHSMGCSLATLIASKSSRLQPIPITEHVVGLVAICPKADPPDEKQVALFRKLLWVPGYIFDLWRQWDRRGGTESKSVIRFVGENADLEARKMQVRFNEQSQTPVWRRMASGTLPIYQNGAPRGGLPGRAEWAGLDVPVFLVGGEADTITKTAEINKITDFLGKSYPIEVEEYEIIPDSVRTHGTNTSAATPSTTHGEGRSAVSSGGTSLDTHNAHENPTTPHEEIAEIPLQPLQPRKLLKAVIIPSPANHALLYLPSTVRILAGLVEDFLSSHVSPRLSLAWQLQFLSSAGKWDVKNLAKWQKVIPVSDHVAGIFRAMKTLREVDEVHSPHAFVSHWGATVKDVIDISHETPVYDPRGLEDGGVHYHKFPTVSKIPPTAVEVSSFIELVDRLREQQDTRAIAENWDEKTYIGMHCHYGMNRTGYFIVCYLVERCGYTVQAAINEFARARPNGIKHAHFLDHLFVRYCVGLKKTLTT